VTILLLTNPGKGSKHFCRQTEHIRKFIVQLKSDGAYSSAMPNTKICPNTSFAEIRGKLCNNMMYLLKAKSNKGKQQS